MKKSVFDLTHERQLTAKADGTLYPIFCEAALPSGKYNLSTECLARMTPLINPVYSRFDIYLHYFFVPNRIIWDNWEDFINPSSALDSQTPVFPSAQWLKDAGEVPEGNFININQDGLAGSLADHLGYQFDVTNTVTTDTSIGLSVLPFRAYQQIWNDHFRDTDLENEIEISKSDGFDNQSESDMNILVLRKKAWEKDYFTSARPYPQRGVSQRVMTEPQLPADGTRAAGNNHLFDHGLVVDPVDGKLMVDGNSSQYGDFDAINLNTQASFSIEELREANAIQNLLERSLKAGAHYWDMLSTFFGVKSRDSRFQKSEFIGGARQPVSISEVLQTSQSDTTPLGTYGGHGISSKYNKIGSFVAPEHGYIIGLMSIMPRAVYANQIRRDYFKQSRFDFFFPDLANLGEQAVYNAEIWGNISIPDSELAFGYQERWAEHRFIPSTIHGQFRNDAVLKNFTAARLGASSYVLDSDFIHVMPEDDVERIFAIDDYDPFLVNVMNHVTAVLPVPRHSNPSLI